MNADFSALYAPPEGTNSGPAGGVLIKVYNNGTFAGSLTNSGSDTTLVFSASNSVPAVVASGATIPDSTEPPFLAFTLNEHATLSDGANELQGNYFRLSPVDPQRRPSSISALSLGVINFPSFTIIGENSQITEPSLAIARSDNTVTLSWPNQNQPFILQSNPSLGAAFENVTTDISFVDNRNTVTLPIDSSSNRFFRLILSPD